MNYSRTPLPKATRMPLGWLALSFFLLILCPFFGFAVHGKVAEPGLMIGVAMMPIPLLALVYLVVRRWYEMRRLPRHIRDEWQLGRVIPAEGAPSLSALVRFSDRKNWMEFRPEGVAFSRHTFLCVQGQGVKKAFEISRVVHQAGQLFFPWSEIAEWIVETDGEGPDYYRVRLNPKGEVKIRRFSPEAASECDVLDAVRSVGKVPVRLLCDVDCEA